MSSPRRTLPELTVPRSWQVMSMDPAKLQSHMEMCNTQAQAMQNQLCWGSWKKMRGGETFCLPGGLLKTLR